MNPLTPLKFEEHGGKPPFLMYECEHVTAGTYPIMMSIPVGEHTNMILCKHCWIHVEGLTLDRMVKRALKKMTPTQLGEFVIAMCASDDDGGE